MPACEHPVPVLSAYVQPLQHVSQLKADILERGDILLQHEAAGVRVIELLTPLGAGYCAAWVTQAGAVEHTVTVSVLPGVLPHGDLVELRTVASDVGQLTLRYIGGVEGRAAEVFRVRRTGVIDKVSVHFLQGPKGAMLGVVDRSACADGPCGGRGDIQLHAFNGKEFVPVKLSAPPVALRPGPAMAPQAEAAPATFVWPQVVSDLLPGVPVVAVSTLRQLPAVPDDAGESTSFWAVGSDTPLTTLQTYGSGAGSSGNGGVYTTTWSVVGPGLLAVADDLDVACACETTSGLRVLRFDGTVLKPWLSPIVGAERDYAEDGPNLPTAYHEVRTWPGAVR